jgi:hypothetical protein
VIMLQVIVVPIAHPFARRARDSGLMEPAYRAIDP